MLAFFSSWLEEESAYNGGEHARGVFAAGEGSCQEEDDDGNRDGGDGEVEFYVAVVDNNNDELDGEAEEEEEVEFEEGDVDLEMVSFCIRGIFRNIGQED